MERTTQDDILADLVALGASTRDVPRLPNGKRPPDDVIDRWARAAALAEPHVREAAVWAIREAAHAAGVIPASIQGLYVARGQGAWDNRTVPALNPPQRSNGNRAPCANVADGNAQTINSAMTAGARR